MKLTIEIDCDNAAFGDCREVEVARILRRLCDDMESRGIRERGLVDANGNKVGTVNIAGSNDKWIY